jgi:hypothetical protein
MLEGACPNSVYNRFRVIGKFINGELERASDIHREATLVLSDYFQRQNRAFLLKNMLSKNPSCFSVGCVSV